LLDEDESLLCTELVWPELAIALVDKIKLCSNGFVYCFGRGFANKKDTLFHEDIVFLSQVELFNAELE
jgi:hypothetical protein